MLHPHQQPSPSARNLLQVETTYAAAYQALEEGNLPVAQRLFGLLAVLEPRGERAWVGLGVCFERKGKLPLAVATYAFGCGLQPDSGWLWLGRGRALSKLGRHLEAERAFDRAAETSDGELFQNTLRQERS